MKAVEKNDAEEVKKLLYDGANPNIVDMDGDSALHSASCGSDKNPEIAKQLISYGADVTLANDHHETPLHWAAKNGHEENCQSLIIHGADCNVVDVVFNTPLNYAAHYGLENICHLLLKNGSDPKIKRRFFKTALDLAKSSNFITDEAKRERIVQLLTKAENGEEF